MGMKKGRYAMSSDENLLREARELLEDLIRIRSTNPPGDEDRILAFIETYLEQRGVESTRVPLEPGRSSLVARIRGEADDSIVLCGHVDTVDADPAKWVMTDPFTPKSEGARLWGLGAADMKSGVAVLIAAVCEVARRGIVPSHDIVLALTADEERGYRGAESIAKSGLIDDATLLVIAEPTGGRVYIGQKGELWVECAFSGQAAHGSIPDAGVNAMLPAAALCLDLDRQRRDFPEIEGRGRTSLNIGKIEAGTQVNIVPDQARVELDLRVVTTEERDRVLSLIEERGRIHAASYGADFSFDVFNDRAPITSNADDPLVERFLNVHSSVTGRGKRIEFAPYSTDAVAIVPQRDLPVVIYGPGRIEQAHQPDEYLDMDSFEEALNIVCEFIGAH